MAFQIGARNSATQQAIPQTCWLLRSEGMDKDMETVQLLRIMQGLLSGSCLPFPLTGSKAIAEYINAYNPHIIPV